MHVSPNDNKKYRYVVLSNGLRVLLINDDQASRSAAALSVNVGHFDDPADREGMAHFLEHMLFLGTEKFPKVGEFQSFINQHGGNNNAWTGTEHTTFFFDINPDLFDEGLERFGQFFYAPLFNADALDKERQAVDSEYKLKLKEDSRRLYQVQKQTTNPQHPFSKFSVGSTDTLADRDGSNTRDEIIAFHQNHYSADLMTAVILGPQDLDQLNQLAEHHFSSITNKNLVGKSIDVPLLTEAQKSQWITIEPLKEMRKLTLSFSLPNIDNFYQTKPLSYIAHLIGYEGPGSLLGYLKNLGYITALSAGGGVRGSNYREFTIGFGLTERGLKYKEKIITITFQFIDLITTSGLDLWRYNEKKAVLESAFRFQEKTKPIDIVSHLVMNMQRFSENDTIYADYMMNEYREQDIKEIINYFTVQNARITLVAQGQEYNQTDDWYDTPYSMTPFTAEQLTLWQNPGNNARLSMPEKNPYICHQLEPHELEGNDGNPKIVQELPGFRLWHKQEHEFRIPKGVIYIAIDSPHAVSTARKIVKTRLCVEMLMDSLSQETYQAEVAGMNYNIYAHQGGVTLAISGFSQKQPLLLDLILNKFSERKFSQKRFDVIKTLLLRNWNNAAKDRPISQLFNALTGILQPNNPPYPDLIEALEGIQVEELPPFVKAMFAEVHIDMFVYGDWLVNDALKLAETVKTTLHVQDQKYDESLRPLIMLGESGTFQKELFCQHADSAILVYYQSVSTEPVNIAIYTLANHLMSATFFHEIRTKQQLGYMVGTGNLPLNKHPGLIMYVQSPMASPAHLQEAIDEFINAFSLVLLELSDYHWNSSKMGLIDQINEVDTNLRTRGQRLWVSIGNKDYQFDQREKVISELSNLSRSEMLRFIVSDLKPRTANRLIMHSQGEAHHELDRLHIGKEIGSIDRFQLRAKDVELG
ncbi:MAG: insulinase family protein [Aliivibrio sp.]|uniref:insulinase family protein n=1 Tax=Aliivibrio sp. TaxID=1872443 RepID=UPI001A5D11D6|nr:insulinase family protein [Aliivibrio sp.]